MVFKSALGFWLGLFLVFCGSSAVAGKCFKIEPSRSGDSGALPVAVGRRPQVSQNRNVPVVAPIYVRNPGRKLPIVLEELAQASGASGDRQDNGYRQVASGSVGFISGYRRSQENIRRRIEWPSAFFDEVIPIQKGSRRFVPTYVIFNFSGAKVLAPQGSSRTPQVTWEEWLRVLPPQKEKSPAASLPQSSASVLAAQVIAKAARKGAEEGVATQAAKSNAANDPIHSEDPDRVADYSRYDFNFRRDEVSFRRAQEASPFDSEGFEARRGEPVPAIEEEAGAAWAQRAIDPVPPASLEVVVDRYQYSGQQVLVVSVVDAKDLTYLSDLADHFYNSSRIEASRLFFKVDDSRLASVATINRFQILRALRALRYFEDAIRSDSPGQAPRFISNNFSQFMTRGFNEDLSRLSRIRSRILIILDNLNEQVGLSGLFSRAGFLGSFYEAFFNETMQGMTSEVKGNLAKLFTISAEMNDISAGGALIESRISGKKGLLEQERELMMFEQKVRNALVRAGVSPYFDFELSFAVWYFTFFLDANLVGQQINALPID